MQKGINWNDYPTKFKRGSCCIKKYHQTMKSNFKKLLVLLIMRFQSLKGEDREYIEKLIA